jgi:hypothetical protein
VFVVCVCVCVCDFIARMSEVSFPSFFLLANPFLTLKYQITKTIPTLPTARQKFLTIFPELI